MTKRRLAHLSDLHIGRSTRDEARARALVDALVADGVEHVVVTGDVTHQGRQQEHRRFRELFAPLLERGALTLVPGNHDRAGDDVGAGWLEGERVLALEREGLYLVCIDSTGEHNRTLHASHGALCEQVVDMVERALGRAPRDALAVLLLHHHLLPLPEETLPEWFASRMGWPHAAELALGAELLRRVRGRCDLILHGHRHVPREFDLGAPGGRPLRMFNAGSSTGLGRFRVFEHAGGQLLAPPLWRLCAQGTAARPGVEGRLSALQHLARHLSASFP
jgi:Icc protein